MLAININKFVIAFSPNTLEENRRLICDVFRVTESQSPGRYLGLPMTIDRKKNEMFNFLSDRVRQKPQGSKNKVMSKAGKYLSLKTAAQSITSA